MQKIVSVLMLALVLTSAVFVTDVEGKDVSIKQLLIKSLSEGVEIQFSERTAVLKNADGTLDELPPLTKESLGKSEELSVPSPIEMGGPEHYRVTRNVDQTEVIVSLGQPLRQQLKIIVRYTQSNGGEWEFRDHSVTKLSEAPEQVLHYVYSEEGVGAIIDMRKRAQSIAYMTAIEAQT
jgi:hypothetical protein